ncbi:MAG: GNAT family N-acetyltransferase [Saprospiraceae bacterium]
MKLHIHPNAADFLDHNRAFLEQEEVTNGLLLGQAIWLNQYPVVDEKTSYFSVSRDSIPVFACMQTPPYNFIFSPSEGLVWQLVLNYLLEHSFEVPGFIGPRQLVTLAAEYWSEKTGAKPEIDMRQLIYRLDEVLPVNEIAGQLRLAQSLDQVLLQDWIKAFSKESLGQSIPMEVAAEMTKHRIDKQNLYVWEDVKGQIVSMAATTRPTSNGICINYVYTPLANRKQGLASACVAALSQRMLDQGFSFCTLFTDEDFKTSNRIYKKIGYRAKVEFLSVGF